MALSNKILFVDDEPRILAGLRRAFYNKNNAWEVVVASSGEEALSLFEKDYFRVVVTDMRMPIMDGAALLKIIQNRYPDTIRIILSGQTELEMVMRSVSVAHIFLAKPCSPIYLEEILKRACKFQDQLPNEEIRKIVCKMGSLPSLPDVYLSLCKALAAENISNEHIASIIEKDIAISAKILQLVNSAFFGIPQKTTNILSAVNYIGIDQLRNLTCLGAFNALKSDDIQSLYIVEKLQKHSLVCANIAKSLLNDQHQAHDAFLVGMLHDIGKLVLSFFYPDEYEIINKRVQESQEDICSIEKAVLGVSHAEVGGYLLGIWGIPHAIVEAVTYHHEPWKVEHSEFGVLDALYVSNCLLDVKESATAINKLYLEKLGVDSMLSQWQDKVDSMRL